MHSTQKKLLALLEDRDVTGYTLRQIAGLIGEDENRPQKIKHHLSQLERKEFISINKSAKKINRINTSYNATTDNIFVTIPVVGSANCGPAAIYAEENIEGFLKVSKQFVSVPNNTNLFAVTAEGTSLNKAKINKKSIESGDYVIVDSQHKLFCDGDYVVSVIDGLANIKKYQRDDEHNRIVLISESTNEQVPIFIHEDDDFIISGKVVDVIKGYKRPEDEIL